MAPILQRNVSPATLLPREQQIEVSQGMMAAIGDQTAAIADLASSIRDLKSGLHAQATFSTSPVAVDAARAAMGAAASILPGDLTPEHRLSGGFSPLVDPTGPLRPAHEPMSTSAARMAAKGALGQSSGHPVASYKEGRQVGLKGLQNQVYNRIARTVSEMDFGGDYYEKVEVPQSYQIEPGQVMDRSFVNIPEGEPTQEIWRNRETGEVADEGGAMKAMKAVTRANALRTAVSAVGSGQSLRAGVAAAAPKLAMGLGYVGMGVTAAQMAYQTYASQLAANRPYQQVLGGGITEGFGERFSQNAFRIRNKLSFNPIGDAESEAIYQGAMRIYGTDRDARGNAQSVMSDLYRSTGMSPEQSLAVIRTAADEGNTALGNIAQSLKNVTATARDAGINAEEARATFARAYEQISQNVRGGGAVALATAQTQAVTALGHGFQNIGMSNDPAWMLQIGSMNGMNPGQVANLAAEDPLKYQEMSDQYRTQMAQNYLSGIGADQLIAQYMQREDLKPGDELLPRHRRELGAIINAQGGSQEMVQSVAQTQLGLTGVEADQAGEAVALASMGLPNAATEMEENIGEMQTQDHTFKEDPVGGASMNRSKLDFAKELGLDDGEAQMALKGGGGSRGTAFRKYIELVENTGQRHPVLERLIREYDSDRRYQVHTKGGEKIVGNWELIDSFADQAQAGDVEIVKGDAKGQTIEEMAGVDLQGYSSEADSATKEYTGKEFDKDDDSGGSGGQVIIKAGPELQKWIDISATGSAVLDNGTGAPTRIPHPTERPTGG